MTLDTPAHVLGIVPSGMMGLILIALPTMVALAIYLAREGSKWSKRQ